MDTKHVHNLCPPVGTKFFEIRDFKVYQQQNFPRRHTQHNEIGHNTSKEGENHGYMKNKRVDKLC
jgi:hypothetical protein